MGRTNESEQIRGKFIAILTNEGFEVLSLAEIFKNAEVYLVTKENQTKLLFIKVSVEKKFWGLNKELFDKLRKYKNDSGLFIILLEDFPKEPRGFVLNVEEFDHLKRSLSIDSKNDYKLHENELSKYWMLGTAEFIKKLIS